MKKILILFAFLITIYYSPVTNAQPITGTVDTTRLNFVTLYTNQELDTITSLSDVYQYYEAAILCDSVLKVGKNADMTKYTLTNAGLWTYIGRYRGSDISNWWFRKKNAETTAVTYSLIIWGIKN